MSKKAEKAAKARKKAAKAERKRKAEVRTLLENDAANRIVRLRELSVEESKKSIVHTPYEDNANFESTNASQWSTAPTQDRLKKSKFLITSKIIEVKRNPNGSIQSLVFDRDSAKEHYRFYKWLAQNPDLVKVLVKNTFRAHQRKLDSALFT